MNTNEQTTSPGIDFPLLHRGKVRDVYDLDQQLLIVATDRISAFDLVLATPITDKGKVLHQLSLFWFDFLQNVVPNHLITGDFNQYPARLKRSAEIAGRSMLVKRARRVDIECVVRGYLAGSGWKEYQKSRSICGIPLPDGLVESSRLPGPIFTPTTKEEGGKHDENISFDETVRRVGAETATAIRDLSLMIYSRARDYALTRGIIIADTKFEFGIVDGKIILIDEVLTPDSSRFWEASRYQEGASQDSLDKQFVRDYLESIHWNKQPPAPLLPDDVVRRTREKYIEAYEKITGRSFVA